MVIKIGDLGLGVVGGLAEAREGRRREGTRIQQRGAGSASHSRAGSPAPFPFPCTPSAYDEHRRAAAVILGRQPCGWRLPGLGRAVTLNETAFYFFEVSFQHRQVGGRETKSSIFRRPCSLTERF